MSDPNRPNLLSTYDQKDLEQTAAILTQRYSGPNILTLEEFKKFEFLYKKHPEPKSDREAVEREEKVKRLSEEMGRVIDKYRPTHIVRSHTDPTVVMRLPQIFVPLKSLAITDANNRVVQINHRDNQSDLPAIQSSAQRAMVSALYNQQVDDDQIKAIVQSRQQTHEILDEFYKRKAGPFVAPTEPETVTSSSHTPPDVSDLFDGFEMEEL